MDIEGIIFDKDGTLFDFEATWSGAMVALLETVAEGDIRMAAARALGFDLDARRFRPESVAIAGTAEDIARAVAPIVGREVGEIIRITDEIAEGTVPVPVVDLVPCLEGLRAFGPLAVATNDSEVPARRHLERAGVSALFDFVSGFDSGHGVKPGPGPLLACATAFGAVPERMLMVGDSLHDLHAGQAAGMRCVGVLTGVAGAEELQPFAEVVLPDIGHLADWIQS